MSPRTGSSDWRKISSSPRGPKNRRWYSAASVEPVARSITAPSSTNGAFSFPDLQEPGGHTAGGTRARNSSSVHGRDGSSSTSVNGCSLSSVTPLVPVRS